MGKKWTDELLQKNVVHGCRGGTAPLCAVVLGRMGSCPMADSLCGHVICLCALKASKEAGQALVCKTNPNFEVHHHHLLHCLEKTTVRTPNTEPLTFTCCPLTCPLSSVSSSEP